MKQLTAIFLFNVTLFVSCGFQETTTASALTPKERMLCDSLKIDTSVIAHIRQYSSAPIEPFHYSLSKIIENGVEKEADPIHLAGLVFSAPATKAENLVLRSYKDLAAKGYSIFILENRFGINDQPDDIGVLKTTDKYEVLKQIQTDGINYDIDNDSLLNIIKKFDKECSLQLVGASGDWCDFIIQKEPRDWKGLANEVYKVCPDVVDQGTGSIDALATEMKNTKRLYFWWD